MKTLLILFAMCLPASAQWVVYYEVPAWCPPQGCQPPQYYNGPGYAGPRRQDPAPDGIETPPVGAPGTPDFSPNPPAPPLPPPPQPTTPPMEPGPNPIEKPPAPQPVAPAPAIDPQAKADQDKLIKEIRESQSTIEKSLIVIRDKPGCQCDNKALEAKLDALIKAVTAIKIPEAPPVTPSTQPAAEEHVVIVADHNAPYWQRLAEAITNAKKTYSGIQDTTLPEFPIGIHPQGVVYRNSVPVRIVKGQYEVENLLSRLSRGESI